MNHFRSLEIRENLLEAEFYKERKIQIGSDGKKEG